MTATVEAERTVLGAVILDNTTLSTVANRLLPAHFSTHGHQTIYRAMLALFERSEGIDLVTLKNEMGAALPEAGGSAYVAGLIEKGEEITEARAQEIRALAGLGGA